MNQNPLNQGVISVNSAGVGEISNEEVVARANEIALIAARTVTIADREQALRELTGRPEIDPQEAMLEPIPEEDRWNPVPGSKGQQARESASEDEDEEGQSESAQLVEEGIREAGHDRMVQAARAAGRGDSGAP